jgi:excisionase family DNA binding protein
MPIERAAEYLSISVTALRSRMKRGTIAPWCYTRFGGSLRFNRKYLDEWLSMPMEQKRKLRRVS